MDKWHKRTSCLDPIGLDGGKEWENRERKERGEEEKDFRDKESIFSLNFSAIGPLNPSETRGKVDPHDKGYVWVPVL